MASTDWSAAVFLEIIANQCCFGAAQAATIAGARKTKVCGYGGRGVSGKSLSLIQYLRAATGAAARPAAVNKYNLVYRLN